MKKTLVKTNSTEVESTDKFRVKGVNKKQLNLLNKGKLPLSILGGLIAGVGIQYAFASAPDTTDDSTDAAANTTEEGSGESEVFEFEAPTTISFSDKVSDDMSFGEAFSAARADTGVGGFFNWKGNTYHTLTKKEWEALSEEEKETYLDEIREHTDFTDGEHNRVDPDPNEDSTPSPDDMVDDEETPEEDENSDTDITPEDEDTIPEDEVVPDEEAEYSDIDEVISESDLIEDLNNEDFSEEADGIEGDVDSENQELDIDDANDIEYDPNFGDDLLKGTGKNLDEMDLDF